MLLQRLFHLFDDDSLCPPILGPLIWPLLLTIPLGRWAEWDRLRSPQLAGRKAGLSCSLGPHQLRGWLGSGAQSFGQLPHLPHAELGFSCLSQGQPACDYLSIYFVTN